MQEQRAYARCSFSNNILNQTLKISASSSLDVLITWNRFNNPRYRESSCMSLNLGDVWMSTELTVMNTISD